MLNGDILKRLYKEQIYDEGFSVFSGGETTKGMEHYSLYPDTPMMQAFLNDEDIQEMSITSGNIGFSRTYRKIFKMKGR